MKIHVKCNGKQQEWDVTPNEYLADTLRSAFRIASSGRPGPVLIDIPKDVTAALTDYQPKPCAGPRPTPAPKEERIRSWNA